jgi:fumarate hydratase subunit beta
MNGACRRLTFPLSEADARSLRIGDSLILDGEIVITAGLPTHQRLVRALDGAEPLPMDLRSQSLFHLGGHSSQEHGRFTMQYINPTTSTRFVPYMPRLIRELGLRAVGGKGGLDRACVNAMEATGCVYLSFLGGGCTLLSQALRGITEVAWPDMLPHYRLVRLKVEGLGPAIVAIDAHGNSCYEQVGSAARERLGGIIAALRAERAEGGRQP